MPVNSSNMPCGFGMKKKFEMPEQLIVAIDSYFDFCDNKIMLNDIKTGKRITKPYTMTGLCDFLNITYETLTEYAKLDGYSDPIKRAKQKVETHVVEMATIGQHNPIFSIFNLKNNFGWVDKHEISVEATNTTPTPLLIEELDKEIKELKQLTGSLDDEE